MMKLKTLSSVLLVSLLSLKAVHAGELVDLYQEAMSKDPRYAYARAQQESAQQSVPIARAYLLPRLSLSGSYGRSLVNNQSPGFPSGMVDRDYAFNPKTADAVISQPIYRQATIDNYKQAGWVVKQADAQLEKSRDDLKVRLIQSYLQVVLAAARQDLITQQKMRYSKILLQAQRSYAAGYGTVTEVAESQSRLDELLSQAVAAKAAYDNRVTELRNIVGNAGYLPRLTGIPAFKPSLHDGHTLQEWVVLAQQNSATLKEQAAKVKQAEYELSKSKSAFLPTLDLRLQYGYDKDPGYTEIQYKTRTMSANLMLNVPIYEGGGTLAQTRRSAADLLAAQEAQRGAQSDLMASIEKEFGNVGAYSVQIETLVKSVETNELLVKATQKSVGAGVRTNIDVLNAENQLFEARLKLTSARIDYLQSLVNLRAATGTIQDDELVKIDEVLNQPSA